MQMLIAFTHDKGSVSLVAPIRGSFNEVLNRRLSYGVACPEEYPAKKTLLYKKKQGPLLIVVPNNQILL